MDLYAVLDQVVALLRQRGRVTYRALKREFQLDDACLEDLKDELINAQRVAVDEQLNLGRAAARHDDAACNHQSALIAAGAAVRPGTVDFFFAIGTKHRVGNSEPAFGSVDRA